MGGAWRDDHSDNIQGAHRGASRKSVREVGDTGAIRYQRGQLPSASWRVGHRSTGAGTAIAAFRLRALAE